MGTEDGIPDCKHAIRRAAAPDAGDNTFPTQMSPMSEGEIPLTCFFCESRMDFRAVESRVDGGSLASPPLRALHKGVRMKAMIQASFGAFGLVLETTIVLESLPSADLFIVTRLCA